MIVKIPNHNGNYYSDIETEIDKLSWMKAFERNYRNELEFDDFYYRIVPILKRIKEL